MTHKKKRSRIIYGNSARTEYLYDDLCRLTGLRSYTGDNVQMQNIAYSFDDVGNVTQISNSANRINGELGGGYVNRYTYDAIGRLVGAQESFGCGNTLEMTYSDNGRLLGKVQSFTGQNMEYRYCGNHQPHAVRRAFNNDDNAMTTFDWDANGNLIQANHYTDAIYYDYSRYLYWNEAGSLQAVVDPRFYSYYGYDGTGERTLKMAGDVSVMDVNADFMQVHAVMRKVTLYTSPYMVATNRGYTKHIYADGERICAKIGTGGLDALCPLVGHDAALTESARNLFDKVRGSMETRKVVETESGCDGGGGTGMTLSRPARRIKAKVGFAIDDFRYTMTDLRAQGGREDDLFFYHPDLCKSREQIQAGLSYAETQQSVRSKHLGSASWITDAAGDAVQHIQYCPFGEPFVNEHATGAGYSERFTFTGKERDEETGYGYFGARYMDHELMTMWLSVDPMSDKYPSISPYAYCAWNPVKLVDPDGKEIHLTFYGKLAIKGFNDIIEKGLGGQLKAAYSKNSDGSYTFSLKATEGGGDKSKLDKYQKAFYEELTNIIEGTTIANIDIVYGATNVHIGSYRNNQVDIADVQQFDDIGEGMCTKQGKLIHEFAEQYYKACAGYSKGTDDGYYSCHHDAIASENNVNGSIRGKESYARGTISQQYSRNGNTTTYSYNTDKPLFKANKNAIINVKKH